MQSHLILQSWGFLLPAGHLPGQPERAVGWPRGGWPAWPTTRRTSGHFREELGLLGGNVWAETSRHELCFCSLACESLPCAFSREAVIVCTLLAYLRKCHGSGELRSNAARLHLKGRRGCLQRFLKVCPSFIKGAEGLDGCLLRLSALIGQWFGWLDAVAACSGRGARDEAHLDRCQPLREKLA